MASRVKIAFVFGSVAQGKESADSDVDVMVIGDVGFSEIVQQLHPTQSTLGREINPKVFSVPEWKSKVAKSDPFVQNVLSKPRIFLIGNDHDLGKLAGH